MVIYRRAGLGVDRDGLGKNLGRDRGGIIVAEDRGRVHQHAPVGQLCRQGADHRFRGGGIGQVAGYRRR